MKDWHTILPKKRSHQLCLAVIFVLTLTIVILFIPGVQKKIVLTQAKKYTDSFSVSYLHLLPWSLEVEELHLRVPSAEVSIGLGKTSFCLSKLLWKIVHIKDLTLKGVRVSVYDTNEPAPEFSFPGLFATIDHGYRLSIERLQLDTEVGLPDNSAIHLNISDAALKADALGVVPLSFSLKQPASNLEVLTNGSIAVTQSEAGGIEELHSSLSVSVVAGIDEPIQFDLDARVTPNSTVQTEPETGESYKAFLGDIVEAKVAIPNRDLIGVSVDSTIEYDARASSINGGYKLEVTEAWLEALIGNESAPLMSEHGRGKFSYKIIDKLLTVDYAGDTRFSTLERLLKENSSLPDFLRFNKSFRVNTNFVDATIDSLETGLSTTEGTSLFTLGLSEPIKIAIEDPASILSSDRTIAKFELAQVPIEWVDGLVPEATLQEGQVSGSFVLETKQGVVQLLPTTPLQLSATKILAKDLPEQTVSVSMEPRVFYSQELLRSDLGKLSFVIENEQALALDVSLKLPFAEDNPPMEVSVTGGMSLDKIKSLSAVSTYVEKFPTPDGMQLDIDTNLLVHPQSVAIQKASVNLKRHDATILKVSGLQPFQVGLVDAPSLNYKSGALAKVEFSGIDLRWANPYLGELEIAGELADATFELVSIANRGFAVRPKEGLSVRNLQIKKNNDKLADNIGIEILPSVEVLANSINITYSDLHVARRGRKLLSSNGSVNLARTPEGIVTDKLELAGKTQINVNELTKIKALSSVVEYDFGKTNWRTTSNYNINYSAEEIIFNNFETRVFANQAQRVKMVSDGVTRLRPKIAKDDPLARHIEGDLRVVVEGITVSEVKDLVNLDGIDFKAINGQFTLRSDGSHLSANFAEPIAITGASINSDGKSLISEFDFRIAGALDTAGSNLDATLSEISLVFASNKSTPAISGDLSFRLQPDRTIPIESLSANIRGDIPILLKQPALMPGHSLSSGSYSVTAQVNPQSEIRGNASLGQLAASNPLAVSEFSANITGKMAADGKGFHFTMPVKGSGKTGETIGELDARFAPQEGKKSRISLDFTSAQFYLNDLLASIAAISAKKPASANGKKKETSPVPPVAINQKPDQKAFWDVLPMESVLAYKIDRLFYTDYVIFNDVSGSIVIRPPQMDIRKLSAHFHDSPMKFNGALKFTENSLAPYDVKLVGTVRDFDLNQFFSELVPGVKPRVEGLFGVAIDAFGTSPNMAQFRNNLFFDTRLQSREGLFRPLPPDSGLMVGASDVLGIVGEGLSYMPTGGFGAGALSRLVNYIKEIDYDVIDIHLTRGDSRDIVIEQFLVQSPTVRLTAAGGIDYELGKDVLDSPLSLDARMSMSGKGAAILYSMDLLEGEEDDYGYTLGPKFEIRGTPNDPQSNFAEIVSTGAKGTVAGGITRPISGLIGNLKHRWFGDDTKPADSSFEMLEPAEVESDPGSPIGRQTDNLDAGTPNIAQ